ncbi:hypothetical protein [Raineyella sp. LH-20]|uniref:hypothetical protein n=1 Tax=Raineyella sp. LH-20 TaxID=3081204 RepID=UPI0029531A91|nr:hypothetical protein [Raineyella sp. LH-20]WOP17455.1 hypothetical protein R0146_09210 [Raineyella sp. LH-20]
MDTPDLSRILADLAAGTIDTAEASRRIEELQGGASRPAAPAPDDAGQSGAATGGGAEAAGPDADGPTSSGTSNDAGTGDGAAATAAGSHDTSGSGPSSAETWAQTASAAQAAGDYLRDVFRSARQAAVKAADAAAEAAGSRPRSGNPESPTTEAGGAAGRPTGVQRVSVRVTGKRVRIVVDPSVTACHVTGDHVLRRHPDLIEVTAEGDFRPHLSGVKLLPLPRRLDDLWRAGRGDGLLIRVNPAMVLDVEVTAGNLHLSNVPRLGRVRLTAGGASIEGFEVVEDALLQAAIVQMSGTVRSGRSRIRVESGQLSLRLGDESNVTVVADSQLGRVTWSGQHTGSGDQVVMGNGSARLDVGVVMGHAGVKIGGDPASEA